MTSLQIRNERLADLSKMIIDGHIVHKLDQIATIFINGRFYFNVFRRYNSPYNIVIEDHNLDIYLHQDHTVRTSLKNVFCLPDYEASNIYTWTATSYKHNGPVPNMDKDIADMRWTDIHGKYQAISVNFGGIFYNIDYNPPMPAEDDIVKDEAPSTPVAQMIPTVTTPPGAPERPTITNEDKTAAYTLLSLVIPRQDNEFKMSETDGPTLSMRFSDIMKRNHHPLQVCYCEMDEDSDDDYDSDDENNFTILRSGTMIPKLTPT